MKKILIIAAHPDDEILGCGGTVARLIQEGYAAFTLILGEGLTARNDYRGARKHKQNTVSLRKQLIRANRILGVQDVFTYGLPDNRFDSLQFLDIVKIIEKIKEKIKPKIVFTHNENDLNIDHRITLKAVLTASRPILGECVKEIYSFEVLSSTEWNYPYDFVPNIFVDIASTINLKIKAMRQYKGELRVFPHPRSLQGIMINAKRWGMYAGIKYAEAFKSIREIR